MEKDFEEIKNRFLKLVLDTYITNFIIPKKNINL